MKAKALMQMEVLHYPNLKTVLMVEDILSRSQKALTREQLKRKLPTQVMHQTLNVILAYLERSGKIYDGRKGIVWTASPGAKMQRALAKSVEM